MPSPNCLRLFEHCERLDDSRAVCTAGSSSATSTPIIAITTRSSTSVKAERIKLRPRGMKWLQTITGELVGAELRRCKREPRQNDAPLHFAPHNKSLPRIAT